ncbi:MAG TPA: ABC transporter transmembrane domain-containing protein, partial [Candidatus Acidoferrum sp.]|nr:ABC transporter transmembrane domain-containing protein [Candidatus Acidoferrum sp.]
MKRLLGYVRPYLAGMAGGILALAIMAVGEFAVTLMIVPIFGKVLNPASSDSDVKLELPGLHWTIYVNHFFPPRIHNVWTVVAISLLILYAVKSASEFVGVSLIQYIGNRAITDLRNAVYAKIIRQPIGFFQQQTSGRIFSAVINDVERARLAISEYL